MDIHFKMAERVKTVCLKLHELGLSGSFVASNGFTKADFITWDNFDELLISASLEIKEDAVECYHSSSRWL